MWFYDRQGERAGPVSPAEMQGLVQGGQVTTATLVWRDGFAGWTAAGQTELAGLFGGPRLPPSLVPAVGGTAVQAYVPGGGGGLPIVVPGVRFAGFWIRTAAYLIDSVILYLFGLVFGLALAALELGIYAATPDYTVVGVVAVLGYVVELVLAILYFVLFVGGGWQATPGKKAVGLIVVSETGRKASYGQALGRYLSYFVSAVIFMFGFFMIGWTVQKRGLHDMMAGTRVIYARG